MDGHALSLHRRERRLQSLIDAVGLLAVGGLVGSGFGITVLLLALLLGLATGWIWNAADPGPGVTTATALAALFVLLVATGGIVLAPAIQVRPILAVMIVVAGSRLSYRQRILSAAGA